MEPKPGIKEISWTNPQNPVETIFKSTMIDENDFELEKLAKIVASEYQLQEVEINLKTTSENRFPIQSVPLFFRNGKEALSNNHLAKRAVLFVSGIRNNPKDEIQNV